MQFGLYAINSDRLCDAHEYNNFFAVLFAWTLASSTHVSNIVEIIENSSLFLNGHFDIEIKLLR